MVMDLDNYEYYLRHSNSGLIKYNMLDSIGLKNHEFTILRKGKMMRGFNIYKTEAFDYVFKVFGLENIGLYHSICYLDNTKMPKRTFGDFFTRSKDAEKRKNKYFKNYKKNVYGYDFIIDIDAPDIDSAYADAIVLFDFFKNYNFPFAVEFSGSKGFHYRIHWCDIKDEVAAKLVKTKRKVLLNKDIVNKVPILLQNLTLWMKKELKLEYLDTSIQQYNRVMRIPYSVHQNNEYVCFPLTDRQFDKFNLEMCRKENVINTFPLKNRSLQYRPGKFSLKLANFK